VGGGGCGGGRGREALLGGAWAQRSLINLMTAQISVRVWGSTLVSSPSHAVPLFCYHYSIMTHAELNNAKRPIDRHRTQ